MPILTTLVGAVSASPAWAGAAATRAVTDRTSAARRVILRPYIDTESGTVSEDQGMAHVTCTALAYAHPGGDLLFSDVSFHVKPGDHVGVVGANGVGKSTLFRVIAGELPADEGDAAVGGRLAFMPQNVGVGDDQRTVRELLTAL